MFEIKKNDKKTILFFIANRVKRDFLYESLAFLHEKNVKLVKADVPLEKKIRKIRILSGLIKSSVLLGLVDSRTSSDLLKEIANTKIYGLNFMGVLKDNVYFSKTRLNTITINRDKLLRTPFLSISKNPQTLINLITRTLVLITNFTKKNV